MVYPSKFFFLRIVTIVLAFSVITPGILFALPEKSLYVEHIVDRAKPLGHAVWVIESADGFTLYREKDARMQRAKLSNSIVIRWEKGVLFVQGKRLKDKTITLLPVNGTIVFHGMTYSGGLRVEVGQKGCILKRYSEPVEDLVDVAHEALEHIRGEQQAQKKKTALSQLETVSKVAEKNDEQKERALGVKVLLAEESLDVPITISIPSGKSWALDPNDREHFVALRGDKIMVERRAKQWWVNGYKVSAGNHCWVRPEGGLCGYRGTTYHGSFLFVVDKEKILVINCLELEAYVSCVLYAETWPGWPLEVNKVMAITCRTYALSMIADARVHHKLYHIKNTNIHQMYEGAHSVKVIHEAVEQTRGLFLAHKNRPIRAMFDSCCGGIVTAKVEGFDFVGAPYLARTQPCTYCKTSKVYRWEVSYSLGDLASRLAPLCPGLTSIVDITISKRDPAGLAKTILIKDKKRSYAVSAKKVYSLLREVKSFSYSINKHGNAVIFRGRGYGHHMGLCQWGAREMVRQGYTYRQILSFYYPGVTLMRL